MELFQKYFLPAHFPLRKELAAIVLIMLIFLIYPYFIREIDATAAAIDPGVYSAVILAVSVVLIFKAATWWIVKMIWPVFFSYSEFHFESNFRSLTASQKVLIYLGFYLIVLYSFIEVLKAVI
jgi:hypothetical protein